MNAYQRLILANLAAKEAPTPIPVGLDAFKDVDVAENFGAEKLAKKRYNPYGVALPQEKEAQTIKEAGEVKKDNFRREMLRDQRNSGW